MNTIGRAAFLISWVLGGTLLGTGCHRLRVSVALAAEATPTPEPKSAGRHTLTQSPPVTVPDLDRLIGLGFTTDEIVAEIERRGVLESPEPGERDHIQRLPSGSRLLDAMDSPGNLLDDAAAARYGRRQAGAPDTEQLRAMQASATRQAVFRANADSLPDNARQQQHTEYRRRQSALANQIDALKQKRAAMQRRGEITATITMEIDRLERERAALVSPL